MYEYKYGNKYVENTELGEKEEVLENNRAAVLDFLDTQEEYFKENGNLPSDWLDSMFFICTKLTRIKKSSYSDAEGFVPGALYCFNRMLEGHLCSQCDDREKCRKEHEKLTKDVTIEKMCMNEVQITELIYQLSEEYIGTNCDENSNDIQYNAGFQDGIEGFRNYVRRELMNNRRK